jgi:hypothetical protein
MPRVGPKGGRPENLNPVRSEEEARAKGRKGGIKSGEVRREKKRMSEIYADFLAERFAIKIDGEMKEITGSSLVGRVVKQVLISGGPGAVSLMKEIREATEGTKNSLLVEGGVSVYIPDNKRGDGPEAKKK